MSLTREDVSEVVCAALTQHRAKDDERHREHHTYIDYLIERDKRKQQRWDRIRTTVIGGAILMLISGLGSLLYWLGAMAIKGWRSTHG